MSEIPSVTVNLTDTEETASVKRVHSEQIKIYEFSTQLARGERNVNVVI